MGRELRMATEQVNYGAWFFRVVAWDGLIPLCVVLLPAVIKYLMPNHRGALEIAALATPAIMFILRLIVGKRHIAANHCSATVRMVQVCVFYFGILVLGFIEGVLILSHLLPPGALFVTTADVIVCVIPITAYLASMTIAMYPGRDISMDGAIWPAEFLDSHER